MSKPSDTREEIKIGEFFDHSSFFKILLLVLLLVTSLFVIVAPDPADSLELQVGQVAPFTLYTDFEFTTEDWEQNQKLADQLAMAEPDYYKISEDATLQLGSRLGEFNNQLKQREKQEKIQAAYQPGENAPLQERVAKINPATLKFLLDILDTPNRKKELDQLIGGQLQEGILAQGVYEKIGDKRIKIIDPQKRRHEVSKDKLITPEKAGRQIAREMLFQYESPEKETIEKEVGESLAVILSPGNLFFDQEFTESRKDQVRREAVKRYKTYPKDTVLFKITDKLTTTDLLNLTAYRKEELKRKDPLEIYKRIGQNILFSLTLILVLGLYLFHIQPMFRQSNRQLWQLGLIVITGLLLNRLSSNIFLLLTKYFQIPRGELIYFVVPMGFSGVVISVIFGVRAAFFAGLFVSAVAALPQENQFLMFFGGLLINGVGALAEKEVKNYRSYFVRAFVSTSLTTLLVSVMFQLKYQPVDFKSESGLKLFCCLNLFPFATGLLTALLAQLGLYLLEMIFGVNTTMSLQSFYDFKHPLLKELQMKAQGTYHHCLMVSTLAETAAEEAGLNPIKARVCGLFHDVGKLGQPEYFTENNSPGQDMHKNLDPKKSAMIIRGHVADWGPKMARKYKLKRLLYDTITQHHGNDVIGFFFKKEKDLHPGEIVSDSDFRYPGPIPSDREISLVMLADCCEAASRSLEKPTPELLAQLVDNIFRNKIRNGQLDDSKLTMQQLTTIRNSFVNTLKTMLHSRIAYPQEDKKDEDDLFMATGKDVPATGKEKD